MDEPFVDPEWGNIKYVKISKYNRTASCFKAELSLTKDLPLNTIVSITYSLLFPRIILFIPLNCFFFHTRNFINIVRPLMNGPTLLRNSEDK